MTDLPPIARDTDPETSHLAAMEVTGRESLVTRIVACVNSHPGLTRGQIAFMLGEPQERVWRRVSDARNKGRIKYGAQAKFQGRMQQTCWPVN